ncbi:MAG: hypothetical protein QOH12_2412 [Solirubrobacteraceae bacterium]|nr:hypothetical protein [Solirubrobacteraceae bacterium]
MTSAPLLTAMLPAAVGRATIPFVGLAEGMLLAAIRRAGGSLQRIRPALDRLRDTFGLDHVLAYSRSTPTVPRCTTTSPSEPAIPEARSARELVVVRKGQHVFASVIEEYLQRVQFGGDGYAELIHLPRYGAADVVADPRRGFAQPIFSHGVAKLEDVLGAFQAGESLEVVAQEYGVPADQLEDALRAASHPISRSPGGVARSR